MQTASHAVAGVYARDFGMEIKLSKNSGLLDISNVLN
jgi:hypothetical protein